MGGAPIEKRYIAVYDVIDDSVTTSVCKCSNLGRQVQSIEIDGVVQPTIATSYQLSIGRHTVKIELKTDEDNNDQLFSGCARLISIVIPEGTTTLRYMFAAGCTNLEEVTVPKSMQTLANYCFSNNKKAKIVHISDVDAFSRITIGNLNSSFFYGTGRLFKGGVEVESITYNTSSFVWCYCLSLKTVVVANNVTSIISNSFRDCNNITSVNVLNGVETIGESAFQGCSSIEDFTFPSTLETVDTRAFYGCSSVNEFTFAYGLKTIGAYSFQNCGNATTIDLPSSIESIGNNCFRSCGKLASLIVRATVPPTCGSSILYAALNTGKIYVPAASVDDYKAASGWSSYASRILPIPT